MSWLVQKYFRPLANTENNSEISHRFTEHPRPDDSADGNITCTGTAGREVLSSGAQGLRPVR